MMESMGTAEINEYLKSLGTKAQTAKTVLQGLTAEQKNRALTQAADALVQEGERILSANEKDCARAEENGMVEKPLSHSEIGRAHV